MRWRALTITLLLLASACPPPRVTNALIAAHRHGRAEAGGGKTFQSRARNRLNTTIQVAPTRSIVEVSGGRPRPSTTLARRVEPPIVLRPRPLSPTSPATLRLRC
jgi:hypothetical protein